jgi:hypothetical protein
MAEKRTNGLHETAQCMKIHDALQIFCQFEGFDHLRDIILLEA